MCFNNLPNEVLYDIVGTVVADYIDLAITTPPRPSWFASYTADQISYVLRVLQVRPPLARRLRFPKSPTIQIGTDDTIWYGVTKEEVAKIIEEAYVRHGFFRKFSFATIDIPPATPPLTKEALDQLSAERAAAYPADPCSEDSDSEDDTDDDSSGPHFTGSIYGTNLRWEDVNQRELLDSFSDVSTEFDSDSEYCSEDEDFDSDISEGEYREMMAAFQMGEASERLPTNAIAPLLGVNGLFRQTTLKIVDDALGVKRARGSKVSIHKKVSAVLRDMRKRWRISHTRCLYWTTDPSVPEYTSGGRPLTPLLAAYLDLCQAAYGLRTVHRINRIDKLAQENPAFTFLPESTLDSGLKMLRVAMRETKYTNLTIPQIAFRTRIGQRAHIFDVRYKMFFALCKHYNDILGVYHKMLTVVGSELTPGFDVKEEFCPMFRQAVHALALYDERKWGKEPFAELPRPLIKPTGIRFLLRQIKNLRLFAEVRRFKEAKTAVHEARDLLQNWRERCAQTQTMYVVLQ